MKTMRTIIVAAVLAASCGEVQTAMMDGAGGTSGGAGSAGSMTGAAGTSGGPGGAAGSQPCYAPADLLSDFGSTAVLAEVDGRHGTWRTYNDHTVGGTQQPSESAALPIPTASDAGNPACSGGGSLHVKASGFSDWGSGFFVPLASTPSQQPHQPYNASRFSGVSFWARAAAPMRATRVEAWDPYTTSPSILSADQACVHSAGAVNNCSPYGATIGDGLIDTTWRRFEVHFADMKQDPLNPGQQSPGNVVDSSRLTTIVFRVGPGQNWEMWVDDVTMVR